MLEKNPKLNIYILHNGCERRGLDASRLKDYFILNGCNVINNPKKANHIILITCSFKRNKERESLGWIKRFKKHKANLIVGGCLPLISPGKLKEEFGESSFTTIAVWQIDELFKEFKYKLNELPDMNYAQPKISNSNLLGIFFIFRRIKLLIKRFFAAFSFSKNYFLGCLWKTHIFNNRMRKIITEEDRLFCNLLRISYGCFGNCSYCGIRNAVGRLRSKTPETILAEYKMMLANNKRNFVFVGDDVGAYGMDIGSSLYELFETLSGVDEGLDTHWYLRHLHPIWVMKYQIGLLKMIKKDRLVGILCPIQSGSSRILKMMNRYIDIDNLVNSLLEFKRNNHKFVISTHIMVGFPSETDDDFFNTLKILKKVRFYNTTIHAYHDINGTEAFNLANKINNKLIQRRMNIAMRELLREGMLYDCDDL